LIVVVTPEAARVSCGPPEAEIIVTAPDAPQEVVVENEGMPVAVVDANGPPCLKRRGAAKTPNNWPTQRKNTNWNWKTIENISEEFCVLDENLINK